MKKILRIYDMLEEKCLILQLALSVCIIFAQIVMRYVLNTSLSWSEELARYLYIWMCWLGISLIEREREHIAIDILKNKFRGMSRKAIERMVQFICIITSSGMAYYGYQMVAFSCASDTSSTALRLPLAVIYAAMPVGCTLYCLRVFLHMLEDLGVIGKTDISGKGAGL